MLDSAIDPAIQAAIDNAVARVTAQFTTQLQQMQQNALPQQLEEETAGNGGNNSKGQRWHASDVGFFDPYFKGKSSANAPPVEHVGKNTIWRDVYVFMDRATAVAHAQGAKLVRKNLSTCLRGQALIWHTSELTDGEQRLLTYGNDLDEWSGALIRRFGGSLAKALEIFSNERFTLDDARCSREPRDFAQTIIQAGKCAQLSVYNQLLQVWNALDVEFRRDMQQPEPDTRLSSFLEELDTRKDIWWELAAARQSERPRGEKRYLNQRENRQFQHIDQRKASPATGGSRNPTLQDHNGYQPSEYNQLRPNYTSAFSSIYQSWPQGYASYQSDHPSDQNKFQASNKQRLMTAPVAALPRSRRPLLLEANASGPLTPNSNSNFASDMKGKLCQKKRHPDMERSVRSQKARCNVAHEGSRRSRSLDVMAMNKKGVLLMKEPMVTRI